MDGLSNNATDERDALIAELKAQQSLYEQQRSLHKQELAEKDQTLASKEKEIQRRDKKITELSERVEAKSRKIDSLEERLRALLIKQFGKSSERFNPNQLSFLNEAEVIAANDSEGSSGGDGADDGTTEVKAHTRRSSNTRNPIPDHLPRIDVPHELDKGELGCDSCGKPMTRIGEDVHERLSIVPRQYFVCRHVRGRYACSCKACAKNAPMPTHPLPGAQVTPVMIAHTMVSKLLDGLPLYRQEKMASRDGLDLSRTKLARWFIGGSKVFQPVLNAFMDSFFSYDIAMSDDTRIRVLKEGEDNPNTQSALWIRRGGPPDKPVVLVDYRASKSAKAAYSLLDAFKGTLVCDGASNFNLSVKTNQLTVALCNDHARRRFVAVHQKLSKDKNNRSSIAIASEGLKRYNALYAIERSIKTLTNAERLQARQEKALPLWASFIEWATTTYSEGVCHAGTSDALHYLLKHQNTLQTYCHDPRLPISNIKSEHVAKTIAIARKNFLFADTAAGVDATARVFSMIETARANDHNPQKYLSVLLTELPNVKTVEDVDALLPWGITPDEIARRYAAYPTP